jgi:hypothetical protein
MQYTVFASTSTRAIPPGHPSARASATGTVAAQTVTAVMAQPHAMK